MRFALRKKAGRCGLHSIRRGGEMWLSFHKGGGGGCGVEAQGEAVTSDFDGLLACTP